MRVVRGDAECLQCEITLREVALLGSATDPSSVREDAAGLGCMVGLLGAGGYVMSGAVGGGEIFVYDELGDLARVIGRPGQGPGELGAQVRVLVGPGDTLYVMDDFPSRLQVMTAAGEFVRSLPVPARFRGFARLEGGDFLFHRTPRAHSDPLFYLLDASGGERARFGVVTVNPVELETWTVSAAPGGGFWTASYWKYELYRWASPDSLDLTLIREAEWFPPFEPDGRIPENMRGMYQTLPPSPLLVHVREDGSGRIWTRTLVPGTDWEPGIPQSPAHEYARRTFDTMVEVIDPGRARVIARQRFDERFGSVCGSHLMYAVVDGPEGDTRVRLVEPVLDP